jgi:hypothetical protein
MCLPFPIYCGLESNLTAPVYCVNERKRTAVLVSLHLISKTTGGLFGLKCRINGLELWVQTAELVMLFLANKSVYVSAGRLRYLI